VNLAGADAASTADAHRAEGSDRCSLAPSDPSEVVRLEDLASAALLREHAESFERATSLPVAIRSTSGAVIAGSGSLALALLQSRFEDVQRSDFDAELTSHAAEGGVVLIAPIVHDLEVVGGLAIGPAPADDGRVRALTRHLLESIDVVSHSGKRALYAGRMHAATLEASYAELLQKNAELEAANLQLRQLDHLRSSFLGTISHELRTPLTSILGYSDMLAEGIAGPLSREQLEFVQTIRTNGEQLLRLILSLLDLSKLESGTLRMHRALLPVERTVRDAIATMLPTASRKGVALSVDTTEPVRDVPHDPDRLRQVFVNLLENSVKFTPSGGEVRVSMREAEAPTEGGVGLALLAPARRELEVRVADSGIGIPPHERARIFDPFYQVDQSSTREKGGTGLGLAIVRRLVDAHDGRIHVEGNTPRGAVFVLRFPIQAASGSMRPSVDGL
jgi:two-component system sensor histidine kinase BarA